MRKYQIRHDILSLVLRYGYMEDPKLMDVLHAHGIKGNMVVGDHEIFSDHSGTLHNWLVRAFRNMLRWSLPTYRYFGLMGQTKVMKEVIPVSFGKTQSTLLEVDY